MSRSRNVLFRCDAGSRMGVGHAVRCLALGNALAREGWRCSFAVNNQFAESLPYGANPEFEIIEATGDSPWNADALYSRWPDGFEVAVVDHYDLDAKFDSSIKGWAKRVAVIDDLIDREHDCDILLCSAPPAGATADNIGSEITLLGPDYALLRDQFAHARAIKLLKKTESNSPLHVHIALGGSPQSALLRNIVEGLALAGPPLDAVVVGGTPDDLSQIATHVNFERIAAASDMAGEMARADIAVGACGGSAWERAALGLPSLALALVDNQIHVARALADAQAAIVMVQGVTATAEQICEAVRSLIEDEKLRTAMSARALRLCDGLGVRRFVLAIDPERDLNGCAIGLRRARAADRESLHELQRHPDTRRFANNPEIPSREEHQAWFGNRLLDPKTLLLIITSAGQSAGFVRLDLFQRDGHPAWLVSIGIAPDMKKRGIAIAALRSVRRLQPDDPFIADVHPDNAASQALFQSAGYDRVGDRTFVSSAEAMTAASHATEDVA
jgi:UDP-2,4-diacetamido-2,4,6-trideoxy-beta-L-altropyranose hydrolase